MQDPVERQRCLTVINQELARLDGMVGKLIELSKIESRHAAFERRVVAVADIVNDALAAFEAVRFGSDVTLNVTVEPGLTVSGDRGALAQAAGQSAQQRLEVHPGPGEAHRPSTPRPTWTTWSSRSRDNGVGVPRAEQEAIFEKFRRGSAAARSGAQGSGLGLAIVRAIVKAHRGRSRRPLERRRAPASASPCPACARRRHDGQLCGRWDRRRRPAAGDAAVRDRRRGRPRDRRGARAQPQASGLPRGGDRRRRDRARAHRRRSAGPGAARHLAAQAERHLGARAPARGAGPRAGDRAVGAPGRVREGRGAAPGRRRLRHQAVRAGRAARARRRRSAPRAPRPGARRRRRRPAPAASRRHAARRRTRCCASAI